MTPMLSVRSCVIGAKLYCAFMLIVNPKMARSDINFLMYVLFLVLFDWSYHIFVGTGSPSFLLFVPVQYVIKQANRIIVRIKFIWGILNFKNSGIVG